MFTLQQVNKRKRHHNVSIGFASCILEEMWTNRQTTGDCNVGQTEYCQVKSTHVVNVTVISYFTEFQTFTNVYTSRPKIIQSAFSNCFKAAFATSFPDINTVADLIHIDKFLKQILT